MKTTALDFLIAELGKALLTNVESFEHLAKQQGVIVSSHNIPYLSTCLHNPPPVHPDIDGAKLGQGGWMAVCQYAIFELIYQLNTKALPFLASIAFGKYDWTQATALEVICRLYIDGKISAEKIKEINDRLEEMRYETHLYFARSLMVRRNRDERFNKIFKQLKNTEFQLVLAELGGNEPLTREELIELGRRIVSAEGTEVEIQQLMELFDRNVPYPKGSNLFYYPEDFNNNVDVSNYDPSVEEVVDKCLNYKSTNS